MINKPESVYVYTKVRPYPTGSGAQVRVYTNIRAYYDLGFDVEVVKFNNDGEPDLTEIPNLPVKVSPLLIKPKRTSIGTRLAFLLGFPTIAVLDYLYPIRSQVQQEVIIREKRNPGAIHHFEYLELASSVVGLNKLKSIWSNHDFNSRRFASLQDMRKEKGPSKSTSRRVVTVNRIKLAERETSRACNLVLTIAEHETTALRRAYREGQFQLLPMSWPEEDLTQRRRSWIDNGVLRLLHLGSVDGFIGFDSLRFILKEVFPLLPPHTVNSLEFWIVGKKSDSPYTTEIMNLSKKYAFIKYFGFVENLSSIYGQVDLQLVGGTRASGLRTRIVESMVYGVPVLSMIEMAKGLHELRHNENILLAENAHEFADEIVKVIDNPECLQKLAMEAIKTYEKFYSRKVEAEALAHYLEKYL